MTREFVLKPFVQIFTIHAFVRAGVLSCYQVPLAFVLMSEKREIDYVAVYLSIKKMIPDLKVETITGKLDYIYFHIVHSPAIINKILNKYLSINNIKGQPSVKSRIINQFLPDRTMPVPSLLAPVKNRAPNTKVQSTEYTI